MTPLCNKNVLCIIPRAKQQVIIEIENRSQKGFQPIVSMCTATMHEPPTGCMTLL